MQLKFKILFENVYHWHYIIFKWCFIFVGDLYIIACVLCGAYWMGRFDWSVTGLLLTTWFEVWNKFIIYKFEFFYYILNAFKIEKKRWPINRKKFTVINVLSTGHNRQKKKTIQSLWIKYSILFRSICGCPMELTKMQLSQKTQLLRSVLYSI